MFKKYFQLLRAFGLRWVLFRLRYALRLRTGVLRWRTPQIPWTAVSSSFADESVERRWVEIFNQEMANERSELAQDSSASAVASAAARELLAGRFLLYGFHSRELGRFPDWHRSPLDNAASAPADKHWSRISDFAHGDIKNIWELSRWSWAFALARAWSRTGDNAYAERFWELAENWMEKNPPNSGPNWKCGQESSFRLFAAVFARAVLDTAPATTPERRAAWRRLVRATGDRIAANLDYALSQSNNHGVSECAGLLTAGALLGGPTGRRWSARAVKALQGQLAELIYADGGFSQHSAVYHRVLVHDLLWARFAFQAAGEEPPAWFCAAAARATAFLAALVDTSSGAAHLYGANDGADILPLSDYDFADFRPVVQAASRAFEGTLVRAGDSPASAHFPDAGVLIWRRRHLSLLLRCPSRFRHRATRDLGHLSVHWRGTPVLLNPGSYSYNTTGHFAEGFSSAFVHNTATCEGADQMEKLGRFLYLPWPRGEVRWLEDGAVFEFINLAYKDRFDATHTRRVRLFTDGTGFEVVDVFESQAEPRSWRLHWLLANGEWLENANGGELRLGEGAGGVGAVVCVLHWETASATEVSCVCAHPATVRGWHSPHYQDAQPARSLALLFPKSTFTEVRTVFRFSVQ